MRASLLSLLLLRHIYWVVAFQPPVLGIGAVLFPVKNTIEPISDDPANIRTALQDAGDFFVDSFWTGKVGGGTRELTEKQRASLQQSQLAEFSSRYGGRRRESELLLCRNTRNDIVACAGIEVESIPDGSIRGPKSKRAPLMSNVAVSRQCRRRGLAEQLAQAVEETCDDWGYDECYLYVEQRNRAAVRLYQKLGYKFQWKDPTARTLLPSESGSLKSSPTVLVCMKKSLRPSSSFFGNMFGR